MSGEPGVTGLQKGVKELKDAVDSLAAFAGPLDDTDTANNEHDENAVLTLCIALQNPAGTVATLLTIQSGCNEEVRRLCTYPQYAREARYCSETSLQAADLSFMAQNFADLMSKSINKLRDRARQRRRNQWTSSNELQFWQDHHRLDRITGIYSSSAQLPNLGESIRPIREGTDADRVLLSYLDQLERIPKYQRIILDHLDQMAWDMVHKYYKDEPWYKDVARK